MMVVVMWMRMVSSVGASCGSWRDHALLSTVLVLLEGHVGCLCLLHLKLTVVVVDTIGSQDAPGVLVDGDGHVVVVVLLHVVAWHLLGLNSNCIVSIAHGLDLRMVVTGLLNARVVGVGSLLSDGDHNEIIIITTCTCSNVVRASDGRRAWWWHGHQCHLWRLMRSRRLSSGYSATILVHVVIDNDGDIAVKRG